MVHPGEVYRDGDRDLGDGHHVEGVPFREPPGPQGLPLEIYCFTDTVDWGEYESIQADIFDHLIAILPEFGLRIFQEPSGLDFARMAQHT